MCSPMYTFDKEDEQAQQVFWFSLPFQNAQLAPSASLGNEALMISNAYRINQCGR